MEKKFLVFFLLLNSLLAQEEVELPIVVSAERFERAYQDSTSSILKITSEDIEKSGTTNVADLLKEQAALNLFTNGAFGKASSLFLRGTSNRHTLVIIDGVRVTDITAIGGGSRLEFLSTSQIESIEVLKGSQGVLYGGEAIGGVIKITSKKRRDRQVFKAQAGSFGQFSLAGNTQLGSSQNGEIYFSHDRADGISSFNDKKVQNAEVDGLETSSVGYRNFVELSGSTLSLDASFQDSQSEFDNSNQDISGNETTYQTWHLSGAWKKALSEAFALEARGTYREITTGSEVVSNGNATLYDYKGKTARLELNAPWIGSQDFEVLSGLSWEREQADALDSSLAQARHRDHLSIFTQVRREIGSLFFEGGGRFESIESVEKRGLYRVALGQKLGLWTLKLHQATGFKAPSLYQSFSSFGNRDLVMERSLSRELSLLYLNPKRGLKFETSLFSINYSNFIDFDSGTNRYENFGAQDNFGLESSLAVNVLENRFLFEANFLRALDPVTGAYALRRPRQRYTASWERKLAKNWLLRGRGLYVGERQERGQMRMPSYLTFDAHLSYNEGTEKLALDFKNILNREYEEIRNFGTPGLNYTFSWMRSF